MTPDLKLIQLHADTIRADLPETAQALDWAVKMLKWMDQNRYGLGHTRPATGPAPEEIDQFKITS